MYLCLRCLLDERRDKTGKRSHLSLWLQTQLLFFLRTLRHKEFTVDFLVFAGPKQKSSEGSLLVVQEPPAGEDKSKHTLEA